MRSSLRIAGLSIIAAGFVLASGRCEAAEGKVHFGLPKAGAEVSSPVTVEMEVEGVKVMPAGEVKPGEGHHHLIVDGGPIKEGDVIPSDATHLHFGKAQTVASVPLTPGKHSLTLQFADGAHRSYGEKLSETIEITVK